MDIKNEEERKKTMSGKVLVMGGSLKTVSYSEISTFENCARQHYYRYFLRLLSKKYLERRNLVIGSIVHDSVNELYQALLSGSVLDRKVANGDLHPFVRTAQLAARKPYRDKEWEPYFDKDAFRLDVAVGEALFWEFVAAWRKDDLCIVGSEVPLEMDFAGRRFVMFLDQIYEEKGGHRLGEMKTRGASFSKSLSGEVTKEDRNLQIRLYLTAMLKNGYDPKGVLYRVFKKPPQRVMDPVSSTAQLIQDYYAEEKGKHHLDVSVPYTPGVHFDVDRFEEEVAQKIEEIDAFYENPYRSMALTPPKEPSRFPCPWCEFFAQCHQGQEADASFSYKTARRAA